MDVVCDNSCSFIDGTRLLTSPPIAKSKSESKPKPNEYLVDANPPG